MDPSFSWPTTVWVHQRAVMVHTNKRADFRAMITFGSYHLPLLCKWSESARKVNIQHGPWKTWEATTPVWNVFPCSWVSYVGVNSSFMGCLGYIRRILYPLLLKCHWVWPSCLKHSPCIVYSGHFHHLLWQTFITWRGSTAVSFSRVKLITFVYSCAASTGCSYCAVILD